jgi:hypothetical protein
MPGNAQYLLFDDQTVRRLGGWDEVKRECLRSFYQPVLLLYELENSEAEVFHNGLQQKETKEFVEKHLANKKPREKSPIAESRPQYNASDMLRPGGPKMISQVIRSRSPSPKSWIIQEPDPASIILVLPSDNTSQTSGSQKSIAKSVHERPNSMTGYALSEIFSSTSCDSTNTLDSVETIKNPLISNHKEGRHSSKSTATIQPIEIYKRRLLVSRVTLRLKKGEDERNNPKTPPKGIIRSLFDEPEKNILGIIHGVNRKGHCVVMGFKQHPVKGESRGATFLFLLSVSPRFLMISWGTTVMHISSAIHFFSITSFVFHFVLIFLTFFVTLITYLLIFFLSV